ncbi:hypothetical protein GCM10025870_26900 [Agromyces marinus]|uniref:Uncharacterized protein n=1 Tax=Agromyces marinus TaxID=1389020 RepID=A0ABM8H4A5_9MICO|nr:hypothetical protein [Agromyces marinus]BDZ55617.1 hypothetical protein GCM10025870_26900 [Agromyces marinus]
MRAGTDTLVNLEPSYRFAIASRTARLLDRVVVQPVNPLTRVFAHAILAVLRPVLVVVPTLFDPPRLALVSGFVAAVAWLLTWDEVPIESWWWFAVAVASAAVAIAAVVIGVASRLHHWAAVAKASEEPWRSRATGALGRARGPAWFMGGVAVASAVPFFIAIVSGNFLLMVLCLGVIVVLGAIAARLATTAARAPIPGRPRRTVAMIAVFAVSGGLLPATQLAWSWISEDPLPNVLAVPEEANWIVLAGGASAVAIALTFDWLGIRYRAPLVGRTRPKLAWYRRITLVNWLTVTFASTGAGLAALWLAAALTTGIQPLLADTIGATVFVLAWANTLWWMPEALRRLPAMDDRVDRAPLG